MLPFGAVALAALLLLLAYANRTRRFYFIRHGETILNAERIKQGAEGSLNESGKAQATHIGELLKPLHIGVIIASPYERAKETAELINASLRTTIRYSPLLVERRNPSDVIGKKTHDPLVEHAVNLMDNAYHADDYRYLDEENFIDLKLRAKKCLAMLTRDSASTTAVVTHHAFLKMVLAYMLYGDALHASDFIKLSYFNTSDNGGISTCDYNPWMRFSKSRGWTIIAYNELPN